MRSSPDLKPRLEPKSPTSLPTLIPAPIPAKASEGHGPTQNRKDIFQRLGRRGYGCGRPGRRAMEDIVWAVA